MDRFKNMHLFKAAQSGKVARSVITLRDLILMYLSFSQSSSKKRTVASKKSKRKLRVDRKWIRNRTRKRGKNGWLKMAVGWEWPYVGKTRSNYSLEQSAIHHRTTAVLEKQLLRRGHGTTIPLRFRRLLLSSRVKEDGLPISSFRHGGKDIFSPASFDFR